MKRPPLKSTITAIFLTCALPVSALADPIITYTFPDSINLGGGFRQKTVDGGLLKQYKNAQGKIVRLGLTCEFAEALDPNNQIFCDKDGHLPGAYKAIRHYAISHRTCRMQFGQIETMARKAANDDNITEDVNRLAGVGWEKAPFCPLIDARDEVMAIYRARGLTAE